MTYSITKDRVEIEKLAIDIYFNQNRTYNFIEGAIIMGFNKFGTYNFVSLLNVVYKMILKIL